MFFLHVVFTNIVGDKCEVTLRKDFGDEKWTKNDIDGVHNILVKNHHADFTKGFEDNIIELPTIKIPTLDETKLNCVMKINK